jgi:dienelactone hydrolase
MKSYYFSIFILLLISITFGETDYPKQREEVLALGKLSKIPTKFKALGFNSAPGIEAIYYEGLPYQGQPTRVFAYLGYPEIKTSQTLPAMVLVHGGGGTAFIEWVKEWTKRGYIAISIATEGQLDVKEKGAKWWKQHDWAGPKRHGIFGDHEKPLKDQWMYHAVADVVLANNLLRADSKVNPHQIGLMGISWGGIITSTVMGIDTRFSHVIPTYGCGQLHVIDNQYGKALGKQDSYQKVWNPMLRMQRATMPALWLSWTGDTHFPLDVQSQNYVKAPGKRMISYIPNMRHGHSVAWRPEESYAFTESIVNNQHTWAEQKELVLDQQHFNMKFKCLKKVDKAILYSTSDLGHTAKRKWVEHNLDFNQVTKIVTLNGTLPENTTAWFVNLTCGKLTVSSDLQDLR